MSVNIGKEKILQFEIPATELAAGTSIELACPYNGFITGASVIVQTAIGTGGDVTFEVGGVAVAGLTLTVADSATKGTVIAEDAPTDNSATREVEIGDRIEIIPASEFASAGALSGYIRINENG